MVLPAALAAVYPADRSVFIRASRDGNATVLRMTSGTCTEATVTLNLTLVNLVAPCPLPVTLDFERDGPPVEFRLLPIDPSKPTHYAWTYHERPGCRRQPGGTTRPVDFDYALPYRPGEHYPVTQVAFGPLSHQRGGPDEHCVDFGLPAFMPMGNYVVIKHDDGTCAEYAHLARGSARVYLREKVRQGQAVGLSGNTGFSTGPHLHFGVYNNVDGSTRITYPVTFHTADGPNQELVLGRVY